MKMPTFSIIVPVYNVEKYLSKCLDSIVNQTYDNYETIIVCDKCNDKSEIIADDYVNKYKKFKKIYKENTGLSLARNIGVNQAKGKYILFLDGDDYLEKDLLKVLNDNITINLDLLRFQVRNITDNNTCEYHEKPFEVTDGINAFKSIISYHYVENAWCYLYNRNFYLENKFEFAKNRVAEDFGLLPLIIAKAKKIKSIDYIGYNYIERPGSLMHEDDYSRKLKKMEDMIYQANNLKKYFEEIPNNELFMMFIENSLITYSTTLKYRDFKKYRRCMMNYGYYNYMICNNFKQRIKRRIIKINAFLYYKLMVR